jgi:hypothetical protein
MLQDVNAITIVTIAINFFIFFVLSRLGGFVVNDNANLHQQKPPVAANHILTLHNMVSNYKQGVSN